MHLYIHIPGYTAAAAAPSEALDPARAAMQTEVHEKAHLLIALFSQTILEFSDVASTASLSS